MSFFDPLVPKVLAVVRDKSLSASETIAALDKLQEEAAELAIATNGLPHYEESNATPGLPELFWATWDAIISLAEEDESEQERLIKLMQAMKADNREPGWKCYDLPASWARMPIWGLNVRERMNGLIIDPGKTDENEIFAQPDIQAVLAGQNWVDVAAHEQGTSTKSVLEAASVARTKWLALHRFLALLWSKADVDGALFALWAARDGLEYPPGSAGRPGSTAQGPWQLRVEVACAWLIGAGERMHESKRIWGPKGDDSWAANAGAPGRGGELWDGVDGYDKERWNVWKRSLQVISDKDSHEKVVSAAKVALHAMSMVEKGTPL